MAYKNDYLKSKAVRGTLDIRSKQEFHKLTDAANEKLESLRLFFFNDHLTDKDVTNLADRISRMSHIQSIHADFGKYSLALL